MRIRFGSQTVIFETVTPTGPPDSLGVQVESLVDVPVAGCRHRALTESEQPENTTDVAVQIWKTTAPPYTTVNGQRVATAALTATSTGRLKVDGVTYEIVGGVKPYPDPQDHQGAAFKVTILSKVQVG